SNSINRLGNPANPLVPMMIRPAIARDADAALPGRKPCAPTDLPAAADSRGIGSEAARKRELGGDLADASRAQSGNLGLDALSARPAIWFEAPATSPGPGLVGSLPVRARGPGPSNYAI